MFTPIGTRLRRNTLVMYFRRVPAQTCLVTMILLHGCITVGPDYAPPRSLLPQTGAQQRLTECLGPLWTSRRWGNGGRRSMIRR